MKKLTFVVGAGASAEYELPLGFELKEKIVSALGRGSGGGLDDEDMHWAISHFAKKTFSGNMAPYEEAAEHIRKALVLSPSIDNFIHSHRENRAIEQLAKLAIAKCILRAESVCKLSPTASGPVIFSSFGDDSRARARPNRDISFNSVSGTWLVEFFRLLTQDCSLQNLKARLSRTAFIVFNYDRCIERFLQQAIMAFYRASESDTREILYHLDVRHPYGALGNLPGDGGESIAFGAQATAETLIRAAGNIKTFTESSAVSDEDSEAIRKLIDVSQKLVFVGFGFIPLNMKLLAAEERRSRSSKKVIYATAKKIAPFDVERIKPELQRLHGSMNDPHVYDGTAGELFGQYTRGIRYDAA